MRYRKIKKKKTKYKIKSLFFIFHLCITVNNIVLLANDK